MPRSPCQTLAVTLMLFWLGGCGHALPGTLHCQPPAHDPDKVELRYLGSGGIYLRWRNDAILIGPQFSNPGYIRAGLLHAKPNADRIQRGLAGVETQYVRAIFAGHSHYDHLGDIPFIAEQYIKDVPIYVNAAGMHILAGEKNLKGRVRELVVGEPPVEVEPKPSFRVRAVASGHAPQLCPWRHFPCVYANAPIDENWTTPLTQHRNRAMSGGQALALVIELLDETGVRYRIYYNDASADSPLGQTVGDFDLAILCIAQWNWVRDYPRDLLAVLRPRHVVISHWDNFFSETGQTAHPVPLLTEGKIKRFTDIVDAKVTEDAGPVRPVCGIRKLHWTMPAPLSTMLFTPNPR